MPPWKKNPDDPARDPGALRLRVSPRTGNLRQSLRANPRLVHNIDLGDHAIDVRLQLIADAVPVEILQDVALHLLLGRTDKIDLHPFELGQQVSQRARRTSAVEFADEGHAKAGQRTFTINRIQVEQCLAWDAGRHRRRRH